MAVVKGVKERVHLPLYDSLFVRPRRQLREISSSSVLRFFVNLQGKTRLETNMQSSSLLPHWNTFEARALRVVVSDLPARFPPAIEECIEGAERANGGADGAIAACLKDLEALIEQEKQTTDQALVQKASDLLVDVRKLVGSSGQAGQFSKHLEVLSALADRKSVEPVLQAYQDLRAARQDLVQLVERTRIAMQDRDSMDRLAERVRRMGEEDSAEALLQQLGKAPGALKALKSMTGLLDEIDRLDLDKAIEALDALGSDIQRAYHRLQRLEQLRDCLQSQPAKAAGQPSLQDIRNCLLERISDPSLLPGKRQLAGQGTEILAQFVYHSVLTFSVGEKVMIQMPTWFFPAGAGPYAEDGQIVTHGFPSPEATFRFAEPVFIDTQQNFRVEIEVPDAEILSELQSLYGPLLIWVMLDGYMIRDVQ